MIYLLIMLRVPRPIPRLTPNLLLDGPDLSRRGSIESVKSVNSATGLLRADSRRSVGSYRAQSPSLRYYVVNASPSDSPFSPTGPATPRPMTQIAQPPATQLSFSGGVGVRRSGSTHPSLPQPLALTNPFLDPPRHGTPDSFVSNLTFSSSAASSSTHTQPHWTSLGLEKYSPIVPTDEKTRLYPHTARPTDLPDSPKSFYSAHSNVYEYGTHDQHQHQHPYLPVQMWSAGASLRAHTNTPHSIHSVAPSMHHCHAAAVLPAPEPVFRPHSAAARLDHRSSLPNPFAMVGNDVRRYGSVPNGQYHHHAHAQQQQQQHRVAPLHGGHVHGGQGGTYVSARNAAHLAGALGKTPPRAEGATQGSEQWRQLVLSAARGRSS